MGILTSGASIQSLEYLSAAEKSATKERSRPTAAIKPHPKWPQIMCSSSLGPGVLEHPLL